MVSFICVHSHSSLVNLSDLPSAYPGALRTAGLGFLVAWGFLSGTPRVHGFPLHMCVLCDRLEGVLVGTGGYGFEF